jgi:Nitroreductase family
MSVGNGSPQLGRGLQPPDAPRTPTVDWEHVIVARSVPADDPTETYHEASRLYPGVVDPFVRGAPLLERSPELRISVTRSVKRHAHLPCVELPAPYPLDTSLADAVGRRRSRRTYGTQPLELRDLATILALAYGVTGALEGTPQALRSVPSGGALFPLELYVAAGNVSGLEPGLFHYDPLRHVLERLRPLDFRSAVESLTPEPELLGASAAVVLVTAMFRRSRFKWDRPQLHNALDLVLLCRACQRAAESLSAWRV